MRWVSVKNRTETAETKSGNCRKRKSCVKLVYICIKFHVMSQVICFNCLSFNISSAWLPRFMVCFLLLCEFIIKHPSGAVLHGAVDKETRMRQASRRGLPNVKKQWAYGLPYLNFRACFMTSTIYSSSAKTIVVSELKSTLRDSSHLSHQMWKYSE